MCNNGTYKAIIYDCDGVMFDSFEANFTLYERIMGHMGRKLERHDREITRILHSYANREVLAHLFPAPDEFQEAVRFAGTMDYLDLVPLMVMEERFVETLDLLQESYQLAVCTNRSTSMEAVLDTFGLTSYFSCVMTASRVANPKPHPEPLLTVLEYYGIAPAEALFVGDSAVDHQAATAAGVPFVAYKADFPSGARIDRHDEIFGLL
ncbi:HAD family hydrolase [Geobacter argillaceus]|nr:HAD family hydrolase [Geobacter argillaceus]